MFRHREVDIRCAILYIHRAWLTLSSDASESAGSSDLHSFSLTIGDQMDTLKIEQRRSDNVIILDLIGKITIGATNRHLQDALRRLVAEGERSIILDLSGATYIDSTGLGEVVAGYSSLQ